MNNPVHYLTDERCVHMIRPRCRRRWARRRRRTCRRCPWGTFQTWPRTRAASRRPGGNCIKIVFPENRFSYTMFKRIGLPKDLLSYWESVFIQFVPASPWSPPSSPRPSRRTSECTLKESGGFSVMCSHWLKSKVRQFFGCCTAG